jgi:hypothetical protein
MKRAIRRWLRAAGVLAFVFSATVCVIERPQIARADIACWTASSTIPVYTTPNVPTAPLCDTAGNMHVTGTVTVNPGPTDAGGIPYVHPTGGPFPVSIATTVPVSLATSVAVTCSAGSACPVNATLQAGSAIAGKFGIDQTTPGTTNGVQTLSGSTTAVTQATASNLNATVVGAGTAGTPSGGVISVQGVTSGTSLNVATVAGSNQVRIQDSGGNTLNGGVYNSDGLAPSALGTLWTVAEATAYNGTSIDRVRKDTYTAGPIWTTEGGSATHTVATGAGNTVVKNSAGRLAGLLVTAGGSAAVTCYDNATTNSGTVIGITPAVTTTGTYYPSGAAAANGITCAGAASSAAVTALYY